MHSISGFVTRILVLCLTSLFIFAGLLTSPLADSIGLLQQSKAGVTELGYRVLTTGVNVWRVNTGGDPWSLAQVKEAFGAPAPVPKVLVVEKGTGRIISGKDVENSDESKLQEEPDIVMDAPPGSALANQSILKTARTFSVLTIPYYYDPEGAPANWPESKMLAKLQKAGNEWRAICNINFEFKGIRGTAYGDQESRRPDEIGAIRWDTLPTNTLGTATTGSIQEGPVQGFWLKLSQTWFAEDTPKRDALLHHVLVHELGHVVGFPHSPVRNSIMFAASEELSDDAELVPSVTENDAKYCWYLRHRWAGKSVEDASALTGIAVE